ncbi:MmgE/PrpD family protein [Chloroflexota bacterium]
MNIQIGEQLAEFTTKTKLEDVPKETIGFAKELLLKTVAGMLAGSRYPTGKKMVKFIKERNQAPEVGVIGCGFKTSPWEAVLAHTIFAHASELEDDRFTPAGGGSWDITVLPVTLALAEKTELSGKDFLEATIVGLEVHTRTCSFPTGHIGFQIVPGAVGPAAGAARALGLGTKETTSALGLAMSTAPISSLNFGTDAHYFESAIHSLHGLMAAEAAKVGMSGNPEIGRYLRYMLGKDKVVPEVIVDNLGSKWCFPEIWIKKYPCCFGSHRQIDAVLDLIREHNLSYEQIGEIEVHISRGDRVLDRPEPKTLGDLQFSFQHLLAAAMLDKDVNLNHFNDERINDAKLKEARAKVKVIVHDDWSPALLVAPALIVAKLKDGKQLTKERKYAVGSPQEPLTQEQVERLYNKLTQGILDEEHIEQTSSQILNIEELDDLMPLFNTLTFGPFLT